MLMPYVVEKDCKFKLLGVFYWHSKSILKDGMFVDFFLTTQLYYCPTWYKQPVAVYFPGFVSQLSPILHQSVINAAGSRCASLQPWCGR